MTTPKTSSGDAPSEGSPQRVTKPEPERKTPDRRPMATAARARPEPAAGATAGEGAPKPPVSEAIAQAVRRAYDVIGENMAQGQAAAEHFRAGEYNIRDVPGDLNALARRLIALTRDASLAACDVLEQLMSDPRMAAGAARPGKAEAGETGEAGKPSATPGGFRSPAPAAPTLRAGAPGEGAHPHSSPPAGTASPAAANPPGPPPGAVKLQVAFQGKAAALKAVSFTPPDPPSPVFCAGLLGPASAPAIRGVAFGAGDTPLGMTLTVTVPDAQPPGVYSGAICATDTQVPVGVLAIEVAK